MLGDVTEPFNARRLQWGVGVEALCDGVGNDGLTFFFQQFDQSPLLRHQLIDLRRLPIQKRRYCILFVSRGKVDEARTDVSESNRLSNTCSKRFHMSDIEQKKLIPQKARTEVTFGSQHYICWTYTGVYL